MSKKAFTAAAEARESRILFALSSATRRRLLVRLMKHDGQRLHELCVGSEMSRQAAMKHIETLAACGLVTMRRSDRETRIFLNQAPIRLVRRTFFEQFL